MGVKENGNELSCGCVRGGRRCAEAQRLYDVMMREWEQIADRGETADWEAFKKATKAYYKHRPWEGK